MGARGMLVKEELSTTGDLPAGADCMLVEEHLKLQSGGILLVDGIVDMPPVWGWTRPEGKAVGRGVLDDKGSDGGGKGCRYGCRFGRHNSVGDLGCWLPKAFTIKQRLF